MKQIFKLFALLIFSIFATAAWVYITTPDARAIQGCLTTKMYKVKLCEKYDTYVHLHNISPLLKSMVLIAEDVTFYSHKGFDWTEISNSMQLNLTRMKLARGGSTITQQLAKNVFLTFDKSFFRKIREALLAREIESTISKDKIFEKYLNVIELGPNIYGVKSAARYYFSKPASDLNLLEAAFITYLIPNPKLYSHVFHKKALTPFARYRILDLCYRMYRFGKATQFQYQQAKKYIDAFPWTNLPSDGILMLDDSLSTTGDEDMHSPTPRLDLPESDTALEYIAPPEPIENDSTIADPAPAPAQEDAQPAEQNKIIKEIREIEQEVNDPDQPFER